MPNADLHSAKAGKNDEFYTQLVDIEREMGAYLAHDPDVFRGKTVLLPCDDPEWSNFTRYFLLNFTKFGLERLISTAKTVDKGKVLSISRDDVTDDSLENSVWQYMAGNGDFRSDEVTQLRDEADVILTNPPFSLFRDFLSWIVEADKQFSIIGNMNAITYKEVFPLIKSNQAWLGQSIHSGDREFRVPETYPLEAAGWRIDEDGNSYIRVKGVRWFTNIDHDRRHRSLSLMTMEDNLRYSKHQSLKDADCYYKYDRYDALEVPFTDAIPSDYAGVMGVPISFLDRYNPEQFEIVGCSYDYGRPAGWDASVKMAGTINGVYVYKRLLIRHKKYV